jgi:DNA-binding beta-propeller fold protein YncE
MLSSSLRHAIVSSLRSPSARGLHAVVAAVLGVGFLGTVEAGSAAGAGSVYVANHDAGNVFQYDVGASGLLTAKAPATVASGTEPVGVAISLDGRSAYVTNRTTSNVFQYDISPTGGLTPKAPATVAAGAGARGLAVSPDGRSAYVTNTAVNNISQYDIAAGGKLTPKVPATVATGGSPIEVAVSPDGRSAYVANQGDNNVSMYDVGAAGQLTLKTPGVVAAGTGPRRLAISADGRSVYVVNLTSANVSQYDVGLGGLLAPKAPATVPAGVGPFGITMSPDGRSAYVTNSLGDNVLQYDVGAGGQLTPKTPATVATGTRPFGVAFRPDGRSAYVSNSDSDSVSQYDVGAGGLLSAKTPTAVAAGDSPSGLVVTPEKGPLASFSAAAGPAGSESGFDASGSSDPDGTIARYDWDFGDGSSAPDGGPRPRHVYASPGTYTVTLRVRDQAGCTGALVFTGQTAYCGPSAAAASQVLAIPSPADTAAPNISCFSLTRRVFRVARARTPLSAQRARRGSRFRFRLSEGASVTIAIKRALPGRRARRRAGPCRATSRRLRGNRRCTRYRAVGTLRRGDLAAGAQRIRFSGRLGRRALRAGSYRATIRATDEAGNRSARSRARFTIVRR